MGTRDAYLLNMDQRDLINLSNAVCNREIDKPAKGLSGFPRGMDKYGIRF